MLKEKLDLELVMKNHKEQVSDFEFIVPYLKCQLMKDINPSEKILDELYVTIVHLQELGYIDFVDGFVNYTGNLRTDFLIEQYRVTYEKVGFFVNKRLDGSIGPTKQSSNFIYELAKSIQKEYIPVRMPYRANGTDRLLTMRFIKDFIYFFNEVTFSSNFYNLDIAHLNSYEEYLDINGLYDFKNDKIAIPSEVAATLKEYVQVALDAFDSLDNQFEEMDQQSAEILLHMTVKNLKAKDAAFILKNAPFFSFFSDTAITIDSPIQFVEETLKFVEDGGDIQKCFDSLKRHLFHIKVSGNAKERKVHADAYKAANEFTYTYTILDPLIEIGITENLFGKDAYRYDERTYETINDSKEDTPPSLIKANGDGINLDSIIERLEDYIRNYTIFTIY